MDAVPLPLILGAALSTVATCPAVDGPVLLIVTAADPHLRAESSAVEARIRKIASPQLQWLPAAVAHRALTAEGGAAERAKSVLQARLRLARAVEKFRELEDSAALTLVADVTASLSAVSQSPGAIELLAEAHLLAGAVFLARGRIDAAQARLRRALQLRPTIEAPPTRYAPRVRAELAALRGDPGPVGRLEIVLSEPAPKAGVFVDGRQRSGTVEPPLQSRPAGTDRIIVEDLPRGRHLVRISAAGQRSFHTTVNVVASQTTRLEARLTPDPEVAQIAQVGRWLTDDEGRRSTLDLLRVRADASAVVLAELKLSDRRGPTATATRAVVLRLNDERPPQTVSLRPADLARGVTALLACHAGIAPPDLAPPLTEWTPPEIEPTKFEAAPAWWTKPWVWAVFAVVVVGTAGALTAARNAEGPPEEVEITLVPRP